MKHKCICQFGPNKCISETHSCSCDQSLFCKRKEDHKCICDVFIFSKYCKSNVHDKCSCKSIGNSNCLVTDQSLHICLCLTNYNECKTSNHLYCMCRSKQNPCRNKTHICICDMNYDECLS